MHPVGAIRGHRGQGNLPTEANHLDPITGVYVKFVDKKYYILNNNAKELLENDGKHKEAAEKLNNSKPIFFTESLSGSNKRYLPEDQWKDYPEHVTKKAKIET